ncbi:MAG TPA: DUF4252 domain-containing protein [Steroidobacteraceae bacterium]|nr:DUF4252 domain-containing protein [Steroidobacteraceae bacterium]
MHHSLPQVLRRVLVCLALIVPATSFAQAGRIDLPSFDGLEKSAINSVNISLDLSLLKLVAQQMHDPDDEAVKGILNGLEGIYVRSFEFARDHAYSQADLDRVRTQIEAAGWSKLVSVHSSAQDQNVEVRVLRVGNRVGGLVVFVTNPRGFTVVNLVGSVDLAQLSQLQGKFGVPNLHLGQKPSGP